MDTLCPLSVSVTHSLSTAARSSHSSCSIYSPSGKRTGLGVNGGCSHNLGGGTQVGTWREQLSRCAWLTDCSLGSGTRSQGAAEDSGLEAGHPINLRHHQHHGQFESAAALLQLHSPVLPTPDQWRGLFHGADECPSGFTLQLQCRVIPTPVWSTFDRPPHSSPARRMSSVIWSTHFSHSG